MYSLVILPPTSAPKDFIKIIINVIIAAGNAIPKFSRNLSFMAHQLGMGLLVGVMDIATANNTVAIVMANPIAKEMADNYGISPRKAASILDTFSCIFQGIIPYGAQMLVAVSVSYLQACPSP